MSSKTGTNSFQSILKFHINCWKWVTYISIITLLTSTIAHAQSFTITPNPASASTDLNVNPGLFQILANSLIYNQTDQTLNMKWERIVNDKPECWSSSVDSPNFQSFPEIDEFEFTLSPNLPNGGDLIVHMYIEGYSGEGQVVLKVSNLDIPSDTVLVTYNFTAANGYVCMPTNVDENHHSDLTLYPNPCSDAFYLTNAQNVNQLIVYNLLGEQVESFNFQPSRSYPITALPKGIYVLEMIDTEGRLLRTEKLVKH